MLANSHLSFMMMKFLSAPKIQAAITGGQAQITVISVKKARTLATNIGIGSLEVQLDELSHSVQSANQVVMLIKVFRQVLLGLL